MSSIVLNFFYSLMMLAVSTSFESQPYLFILFAVATALAAVFFVIAMQTRASQMWKASFWCFALANTTPLLGWGLMMLGIFHAPGP